MAVDHHAAQPARFLGRNAPELRVERLGEEIHLGQRRVFLSLGLLLSALGFCTFLGEETTLERHAMKSGPGQDQRNRLSGAHAADVRVVCSRDFGKSRRPVGRADITAQVEFDSLPATVRRAINDYVARTYPQAIPYMKWDSAGRSLSASKLGASCRIVLSGTGSTVVGISGDIGFPASLFVSENQLKNGLNQAIRDIKKRTS